MSSIGASYAGVYVMKKHQKEKMKRMEDERVKRGDVVISSTEERKVGGSGVSRSNKVHPGTNSAGEPGET
ncbi:hypothetical protein O6P43_023253 [Quillaja saponaria]|uniref:Uncharacterized protein n=1 Tax=Quillaja saponaria TaxID=32244 RepID=A0AAD7PII2_QUISA|nr:hypothetical protein O6P43_023253 [Quillaja saponaria]